MPEPGKVPTLRTDINTPVGFVLLGMAIVATLAWLFPDGHSMGNWALFYSLLAGANFQTLALIVESSDG